MTVETPLPRLAELGLDLCETSTARRWVVVGRPFVFAALHGVCLVAELWWVVPITLAALFLSIVAAAHDLVHGSLGLSRRANDVWLSLIGMMVLESGHAYRSSHLQHHRRFPRDDDPEGAPAHGTYLQAVLAGPTFLFRLYRWAWRRQFSWWLVVEGAWFVVAVGAAAVAWQWTPLPAFYVASVIVASWAYPLMTVRLVHDPSAVNPLNRTRTIRGLVLPSMFLELSYHLEHHLYPSVPSHRYRELSQRLEPTLQSRGVVPLMFGRRGSARS